MSNAPELSQALGAFLDPAAIGIVVGGAALATVLRTPWRDMRRALAAIAVLPRRRFDAQPMLDQIAALGRIARRHGTIALDRSVITDPDVAAAIAGVVDALPVGEIDFGTITHLMIGRMRPLPDGNLTYDFDIDDAQGPQWAQSAIAAAHAAGRKAIIMIGGAGEIDGWRGAAETAQKRELFVLNLQELEETWGVDGFDLDWEPLEDADKPNFKALAQLLRARLPNSLLTVPVGWFNPNYMTPDPYWAEIAPLFDRINVMTYDMAGPWDGWQSWHNSALSGASPTTPSSVVTSVTFYLTSGVPTSRLGIGSAFYGYCWQGVTGPLQDGGSLSVGNETLSYATIIDDYYSPSLRQWDATASVPYLSSAAPIGAGACNFVSYEDEQSIAAKGYYARAQSRRRHHLDDRRRPPRRPAARAAGSAARSDPHRISAIAGRRRCVSAASPCARGPARASARRIRPSVPPRRSDRARQSQRCSGRRHRYSQRHQCR